jgi:hypothetical protein
MDTIVNIKEKQDLGRALIVLGRKLRDGVDPEVSSETLNTLLSLMSDLPEPEGPQFVRQPKVDGLMELILEWIRNGDPVPTGSDHKTIQNALTKLRRNGQILNIGTARIPKWRLTTPDEQKQIAKEVRDRRKEYDLRRASQSSYPNSK